jgi:hypothetical protein
MLRVVFRLDAEGCSCGLVEMCEWLDRRRFDPSPFFYDRIENETVLCVDFTSDEEAEEFAAAFGGEILIGCAQRGPPVG